ncbi:helicase-related protein [Mycobacterium sp. E1386]|uniref:helicase-related protein n=1 Tax=Mycobacterium sp. E1386 TaxID=1834126 RepID=UPI0012EA8DC8|nr:helicase-related protein [Mycobacterium sp. E1386]
MTETRTFAQLRDDVATFLRGQYLGPAGTDDEIIRDRPDRVYLVGTLYPRGGAAQRLDGDVLGEEGHDDGLDEPIELANAWYPASAAISFLHDAPEISCSVSAARYRRVPDRSGWERQQMTEKDVQISFGTQPVTVLGGAARIVAVWRRLGDAWLVTVAVENMAVHDDAESPPPTEECLFQVNLRCAVVGGQIRPYPSVSLLSDDQEDQELRLLYRNKNVYGVGHGCSVTWDDSASAKSWVATEMLPKVTVPGVSPGDRDRRVLRLEFLSDDAIHPDELVAELTSFVDGYSDWISECKKEAATLEAHFTPAATRLTGRMDVALNRMRQGIATLGSAPDVRTAFRLANWSMREQILQSNHVKQAAGRRGTPLEPRLADLPEPAWYPFQLAFQLLTIASTASSSHPDRSTVDLIWFPTGGGKTEAYLAVAAFEMIHRRLTRGGRGGGTAVLTRYTLRMLTAQQFQRAATLICALQHLREIDDRLSGTATFSIGLWVGADTTPNDYRSAHAATRALFNASEPESPFQITNCPWCGTDLLPKKRTTDRSAYGVSSTNYGFALNCPHPDCPFHEELPVKVIDEQMFADPPTLIVATVDKLARMPWQSEAGAILGRGNMPYDPPGLVIQDELHLLSGPLGTTVALYEAAVLGLMGWDGKRPKVIASTATIRSAPEQVQRLYGSQVALFPPSGLEADSSYFARVDENSPGRMFLGLMPQAHTQSFATVLASTALLEAPLAVGSERIQLDAYWTVVAYHNSLRELGRTVTIARDDVESMLTARAAVKGVNGRRIQRDGVIELTSNVSPGLLAKYMNRLGRRVDEGDAVDLVATTNLLSVGIDISRLGLMLMNGQPKTTSEYIQATSRVGRSTVPGLVVTLLRASKPRDRSHYESFRAYHESIYRYVEPTSVTPWSAASRDRSLHAALVMLVRHGAGLRANGDAGRFRAEDRSVRRAVEILLSAVEKAEPESRAQAEVELRRLVAEWERRAREADATGTPLRYQSSDSDYPALLRDFGERKDGWQTMHSMRSVDRSVRVIAIGESL